MKPELLVVMVSWQGLEYTRAAYEHVMAQVDTSFRLVLWDNASTDGTQEWMRSLPPAPNVELVFSEKNLLWIPAIIAAVERFWDGEPYLAWMNNDMYLPSRCFARMTQHFKDNANLGFLAPVGHGLGGAQDYTQYGYWPDLLAGLPAGQRSDWHQLEPFLQGRPLMDARFISGALAMTTRAVWDELGPLDEKLVLSCDDMEFSIRMHANDYRVGVAMDVFAYHEDHATGTLGAAAWDANLNAGYQYFVEKWRSYLRLHPYLMEGVLAEHAFM